VLKNAMQRVNSKFPHCRETRLLFEEGVSTSWDRQMVKQVVAHELAHQWFGNLVTANWWDLIWLNEGFATYFEYHSLISVSKRMET
jgi:aminopeptidase N